MVKSYYIVILVKSQKNLELVSSLQNFVKKYVTNVSHTAQQYLNKFHFDST